MKPSMNGERPMEPNEDRQEHEYWGVDEDGDEVGAWWQSEDGQGEIGPYPLSMSDEEIMQEIIEAGDPDGDFEWVRRGEISRPRD